MALLSAALITHVASMASNPCGSCTTDKDCPTYIDSWGVSQYGGDQVCAAGRCLQALGKACAGDPNSGGVSSFYGGGQICASGVCENDKMDCSSGTCTPVTQCVTPERCRAISAAHAASGACDPVAPYTHSHWAAAGQIAADTRVGSGPGGKGKGEISSASAPRCSLMPALAAACTILVAALAAY